MPILDLDVVLTDYAVGLECLYFCYQLKKQVADWYRSLFFLTIAISAFLGGTYHGFFPLKTATPIGFWLWIFTLIGIGGTAFCLWQFVLKTSAIPSILWSGFVLYILFVDYRFRGAVVFYLIPLLVFTLNNLRGFWKTREAHYRWGLFAGLMTLSASIFQQMKIGLHPTYFDHNALYHFIEMWALLCFYFCFRLPNRAMTTC